MRSTAKTKLQQELPKPSKVDDHEEAPESRALDEARCQACSIRMPQFDGRRVALSATVACTAKCWESLGGHVWGPRPFDDEPTIA
jgi:hypothetical protein